MVKFGSKQKTTSKENAFNCLIWKGGKNMKNSNNTKVCAFYASDYHFEMISLPYIEKNISLGKNVIIFTEEDLSKTINVLLSRLTLEESKKAKILQINWKNNDQEKIQDVKNIKNQNKNVTIFVKGNKKYIYETNEKLKEIIDNSSCNIIDCYNIESIDNIKKVQEQYNKVLNTSGLIEIK